jgi:copper resistance protein C
MKNLSLGAVAVATLVFGGAPAFAHAHLDHSAPGVGSTVKTAPTQVRIWFTEALEPAFSSIAVTDDAGHAEGKGKARVDPSDPKLLILDLAPLPPGTYHVAWHVVSIDTHRTEGDFTFTVTGP